MADGFARLGRLLWQKILVDVWKDTTLCDSDMAQQLVQLLIVSDGELKMPGNDTGLLVVTGGVSGQLENFGSQVLENGSQIDGSTSSNSLGVVALPQESMNSADWKREAGFGRSRLRVLAAAGLAAGFASSHFGCE